MNYNNAKSPFHYIVIASKWGISANITKYLHHYVGRKIFRINAVTNHQKYKAAAYRTDLSDVLALDGWNNFEMFCLQ